MFHIRMRIIYRQCLLALATVICSLFSIITAVQPVHAASYYKTSYSVINYDSATVSITTNDLTAGTAGIYYNVTLSATGGSGIYTWKVSGGALPQGLSLSESGVITGTPKLASTYNVIIQVTDSKYRTATQAFTLVIRSLSSTGVTITTPSLPRGVVGTYYSSTLTATGGTGTYTWLLVSGKLPDGLSLNSGGSITGTPTAAYTYDFVIKAMDSKSAGVSNSFSIPIVSPGDAATLTILRGLLPNGLVGVYYSTELTASGGMGEYTWKISSGNLPDGLTLSSKGIISGTPAAASISTFTVLVTDPSSFSGSRTYTISVISADYTHIIISTPSLPNGTEGVSYSKTLMASGGAGSYSWKVSDGELPPGLRLNSQGVIWGTPAAAATCNFTARITDANSLTAEKTFTLVINAKTPPANSTPPASTSSPQPDIPAENQTSATTAASSNTTATGNTEKKAGNDYTILWVGIVIVIVALIILRIRVVIRKEKQSHQDDD